MLVLTEEGVRVRAEVMRRTLEQSRFASLDGDQLATLVHLFGIALGTPAQKPE